MKVFGHEYGFLLTVGAAADIGNLCPNGDIEKLGDALNGSFSRTIDTTIGIMVAMSKGYEYNRAFENPDYTPNPLTAEIIKALPQTAFSELEGEALKAFTASNERTVEVEAAKKN